MTDNTRINAGTTGDTIASDEINTLNGVSVDGVKPKAERVKPGFGDDGVFQDVSATYPFPVIDSALEATLTSVLARLSADPATQTTLAAVLAKLSSDPATGANQGTQATKLDALHTDLASLLAAGSGDVAATLTDNRKTVTTPGTAVALRASLACKWVCVTALRTNTDQVNIGGSSVLATSGSSTGTPLMAGETITIPVNDASKVFIDARVANEGVSFTVGV